MEPKETKKGKSFGSITRPENYSFRDVSSRKYRCTCTLRRKVRSYSAIGPDVSPCADSSMTRIWFCRYCHLWGEISAPNGATWHPLCNTHKRLILEDRWTKNAHPLHPCRVAPAEINARKLSLDTPDSDFNSPIGAPRPSARRLIPITNGH